MSFHDGPPAVVLDGSGLVCRSAGDSPAASAVVRQAGQSSSKSRRLNSPQVSFSVGDAKSRTVGTLLVAIRIGLVRSNTNERVIMFRSTRSWLGGPPRSRG